MINSSITLRSDGTGSVTIDGHDVSGAVNSVSLFAEPGKATRATLGLIVAKMDGEVSKIELDWATTEALKALGWTPPEGNR